MTPNTKRKVETDRSLWIKLSNIKDRVLSSPCQKAIRDSQAEFRSILKDHYYCFPELVLEKTTTFHRIRKINKKNPEISSAKDIWYPPKEMGLTGNRASTGDIRQLYMASDLRIATVESRIKKGDYFCSATISPSKQSRLRVASLGFDNIMDEHTTSPLHAEQARREWKEAKKFLSSKDFLKWSTIKIFVSQSFAHERSDSYKWTNFISSIYLDDDVEAIIYPSFHVPFYDAFNIAVRADKADEFLKIVEMRLFEFADDLIIQRHTFPQIDHDTFRPPYSEHVY